MTPAFTEDEQSFAGIAASLKRCGAVLREANIPFLLAGSLASWARGGPESRHDLDFFIRPEDAERAVEALEAAGMRREIPPEGWLVKVWDGEVLVDLIFDPTGIAVDDELFARSESLSVLSFELKVLPLEDLLVTKLLAMTEHHFDFYGVLRIARALREQIDWDDVRRRTDGNPFAAAYFVLVEQLGIVDPSADSVRA